MQIEDHKKAPGGQMPSGAKPYAFLTCGYCRNSQLRTRRVEKCRNYSASTSASVSTSASTTSVSSSAGASSVTPTRTLTVAEISR